MNIEIVADIEGIRYKPYLCKDLNKSIYSIKNIEEALSKEATFMLKMEENKSIAVSWWVSPKRTRSYPYARVYDSLDFIGKKATIIPVMKDEGKDGDRDFLQWDTISLMSLLGIYTIISYYIRADKHPKYNNKITNQRFDIEHIKRTIRELLDYQSDALHWNLKQLDNVSEISNRALDAYQRISNDLNVKMHSAESIKLRIKELLKGRDNFIKLSRSLARNAQKRETVTRQPKEDLGEGKKAAITIRNCLGGNYYFTCDEIELKDDDNIVYLIEGKHTATGILPSLEDIKDGLLKMILYTNLKNVTINGKQYRHIPVLKLTTKMDFKGHSLQDLFNSKKYKWIINKLIEEANENNFKILLNDIYLN